MKISCWKIQVKFLDNFHLFSSIKFDFQLLNYSAQLHDIYCICRDLFVYHVAFMFKLIRTCSFIKPTSVEDWPFIRYRQFEYL